MLVDVLKKSWKQHSIKQQLYSHLPLSYKLSKYVFANLQRLIYTSADTGYSVKGLPEAMDDINGWR